MLSNLITKVENLLRQSIIHLLMALAKKKIGNSLIEITDEVPDKEKRTRREGK